jgi:transposase
LPARAVFTAIVYVLTSGCAWRDLPPSFGVPFQTAHRRFSQWTEAGLWRELHHAILDELGSQGLLDRSRAIIDGACVRAKRGSMTGPSPVDRGKPGSKIHVLSERCGLPLTVAISAANTHDSHALKPLVMAIPAIKSQRGPRRRKPGKLHADKAYDHADLRNWVRDRGIGVRIARKGIDTNTRLGRHRWVIERTTAWITGYRRLTLRYERKATHFLAFLILGATITSIVVWRHQAVTETSRARGDRRRGVGGHQLLACEARVDPVDHMSGQRREVGHRLVLDLALGPVGPPQIHRGVVAAMPPLVHIARLRNSDYVNLPRIPHHILTITKYHRETRHDTPTILTTTHGPETAKQQVGTQKLPRATATSA